MTDTQLKLKHTFLFLSGNHSLKYFYFTLSPEFHTSSTFPVLRYLYTSKLSSTLADYPCISSLQFFMTYWACCVFCSWTSCLALSNKKIRLIAKTRPNSERIRGTTCSTFPSNIIDLNESIYVDKLYNEFYNFTSSLSRITLTIKKTLAHRQQIAFVEVQHKFSASFHSRNSELINYTIFLPNPVIALRYTRDWEPEEPISIYNFPHVVN